MMKPIVFAFIVLTISVRLSCADSSLPTRLGLDASALSTEVSSPDAGSLASIPPLSLTGLAHPGTLGSQFDPSNLNFAQLGSSSPAMPNPYRLMVTLLAIFVLALRVMSLNRARALADHERDSYQGKARMFRTMHEGGADH